MPPNDGPSISLRNRYVVPRWRSPEESIDQSTSRGKPPLPLSKLKREAWILKISERFAQNPTKFTATEYVETASALGVEVLDVSAINHYSVGIDAFFSQRQLSKKSNLPGTSTGSQLDEITQTARTAVAQLRARAAHAPKQPFVWSELARHYLTLGEHKKAKKAMYCASSLSPKSIYLTRCASRLFSTLSEPDQALWVLRRHGLVAHNPWLLSAELATSASIDKASAYFKRATAMLEDAAHSPRSVTELAAAVGSIEHINGRHKKAKQHFAKSLIDPTANALAQAQWASQGDSKISIPASAWAVSEAFEARALAARSERNWSHSQAMCTQWIKEEPFDYRAAAIGSHASFVPGLERTCELFATVGLHASPGEPGLLNNRAVARAFLGNFEGAFGDISEAAKSDPKDLHILATVGLVAYRLGDFQLGGEAYSLSIAGFVIKRDLPSAALAALYCIREQIRARLPGVKNEFDRIKRILTRMTDKALDPEIQTMLLLAESEADSCSELAYLSDLVVSEQTVALRGSMESCDLVPGARSLVTGDLCSTGKLIGASRILVASN